jgi:hypothetical protein
MGCPGISAVSDVCVLQVVRFLCVWGGGCAARERRE